MASTLPARDSFRHILVAVDGSDVSFQALAHASRIAKADGAELYAVHVVPSPPFEYTGELADYYDQARHSSIRWMKEVENEAAKLGIGIRTETIVGASSVVDTIVGYADSISCDLIVTGTRGRVHRYLNRSNLYCLQDAVRGARERLPEGLTMLARRAPL